MKKKFILTLPLLLGSLAPVADAANLPVYTSYQFSDNSPLSSGKWVRFSIGDTGIYEITYAQLRAMGFSNPAAVAVYGNSGYQLPVNFMSANGERLVEDNIMPVRIMHSNDKIIFYGQGTAKINFKISGYGSNLSAQHFRESKNVYSDKAYYFLTDSRAGATVPTHPVAQKESARNISSGYAYLYHEKDLTQGTHLSGQTFWGENIKAGSPVQFQIRAPYMPATNKCTVTTDVAIMEKETGNLTIRLGGSRTWSLNRTESKLYTLENTISSMKLTVGADNTGSGTLSYTATGGYSTSQPLGLDYWTVTYPISLEYALNDNSFTQQYIAFKSTSNPIWKHPVPAGSLAWDITDHGAPEALDTEDGWLYHDYTGRCETVVFNPAKTLKTINSDYVAIENQNLHALRDEAIDMLIFTTDDMEPYARRIADLHASHLGQRVEVVKPQALFNEFSSGTPDPMAYRMLTKILYQNESHRLKNVLFMGPIYGDYRDVRNSGRKEEGHIAYQQLQPNLSAEGHCVMDYYGVMSDYVTYPDNLENAPVSVGVGILPINSSEEGELAVAKIKEYLEKEDFSGLVNETMAISCAGDSYLHDNQAIRLGQLFQTYANGYNSEFAHRNIWIEALGADLANKQIHSTLNMGKLFSIYYGHAGTGGMSGFGVTDAVTVTNPELGFLFLAACDLCRPDNSEHGIGDMAVIRSKRGFMGSICATRSVLSNHNDNLARNLVNSLFLDSNNSRRTVTPSIGEAYARAKDRSVNDTEIDYMLIGDPGLPIPVALGNIELSVAPGNYRAGDVVEIKGRVTGSGESTLSDYNGYVTVKLMEPVRSVPAITYVDDNGNTQITREEIKYNDLRLQTVKSKVTGGEFSVRLVMPKECDNYLAAAGGSASLPVMAGAYDPSSRLGMSGIGSISLAQAGSEPAPETEKDTEAPTVSVTFDSGLLVLKIESADDTAMLPGIGQSCGTILNVDGNAIEIAHEYSDGVTVPEYSAAVSVARLGAGLHTATYYATDIAGNSCRPQSLQFAITDKSPLRLTADREVAIDTINFKIAGNENETLQLIVSDSEGNIVAESETTGPDAECDTTGIKPGTYRAAVRSNSARGSKIYSNWVEFTVID